MKKTICLSLVCLIVCMVLAGVALCTEDKKNESRLTVPWDEFKQLLPLDKDEVVLSMETFQKLLVYSGIEITPAHTLIQGNVVLTRAEFKNMIAGLKPPVKGVKETLPFDYLITRAIYEGQAENGSVSFTGVFNANVLKTGDYIKIPLLPQNIALDDIRLDGEPALVLIENGYHYVMLSGPGEHEARVSFSLKPEVEKGTHRISLSIQQTPITLLNFGLAVKDVVVDIPQAQQMQTTAKDGLTMVSASIMPTRVMNISWRNKDAVVEKLPPKVYSEVLHLVSIDDDALKINSEISYRIFHSEINSTRVLIPGDMNVLNVFGEGVGEWRETMEKDQQVLFVPFTYEKKGTAVITVVCEKPLTGNNLANGFVGLQTLDTVHETGYIGMELNTSAEVKITESTGLETIAAQKLPSSLYNKSVRPLMYAFKYARQPFSLAFDTKKHEKVAVPVAAISSANVVTLFTEDGKVVYHLVYHVKNSAKQFLKFQLPEKADVWSVFVDDKPVESSLDAQGRLLVPLIRSRAEKKGLATYPVEVIYCMTGDKFSFSGLRESRLPAVDLLVSRLIWSVYLPNDYAYHYFTSTLEKEEMIRGVNLFAGSQRQYNEKAMNDICLSAEKKAGQLGRQELEQVYQGKEYGSRFKNLALDEAQISSQVQAELNFSGRLNRLAQAPQAHVSGGSSGLGVMPIHIAIPTSGQVYRFAKTIIRSDDALKVQVVYSSSRMARIGGWILGGVLIWLIYLLRRVIKRLSGNVKDRFNGVFEAVSTHKDSLGNIARARMTPYILLGLVIACYFISGKLALAMFFLLWVSVVYRFFHDHKQNDEQIASGEVG